MKRVGTQKKILDAAEALFAKDGFYATSLRQITAMAGVNVAAVNYHFGSKEALLDNVLERRLVPLNKARMDMLESVMAESAATGKRPSVKALMHAFIAPTISFRETGQGARNFIALAGRAISEPSSRVHQSFFKFMEPFISLMISSLKEALPGLAPDLLLLRFHFSVGMLIHILRISDNHDLPEQLSMKMFSGKIGKNKIESGAISTDRLIDEAVGFVTAGLEV